MKKIALLIGFCLLLCIEQSTAQLSKGGTPRSFNDLSIPAIEAVQVAPLSPAIIQKEIASSERAGMYKVGKLIAVNKNPDNSGTWLNMSDGGKLWRLKLQSVGAKALGVFYNQFNLPHGATLFLYNEDKKQVIGAFTDENNPKSGYFANELIEGETVTLEYYQPAGLRIKPQLNISDISYVYRETRFMFRDVKDFGQSDVCEVNVNCSEGANWQDQKRGIVRILLLAGGSQGYCSGSLINNTSQDCTPYLLTADHCSHDQFGNVASASDMSQWVFYFNYEAPTCANPGSEGTLASHTMTGCTEKAATGGSGSNGDSDFFLVELDQSVPSSLNPYFNGWDRNSSPSSSGVCIHHPKADIKKISTYTSPLIAYQYSTSAYTHWQVTWASTANGYGVTEGGSSGSPIFSSGGRIVGELTGGGSFCNTPTQSDYYGRFYFSWDQNGTGSGIQLKPWLDPGNTGVTTLDGTNMPCGVVNSPPVANFIAAPLTVYVAQTVTFTDQSTNNPTSWSWVITPNTFTYTGGTSATSQNPQVTFSAVGFYTATLTVSNAFGSNSMTRTNYIDVVTTSTALCDTTGNFNINTDTATIIITAHGTHISGSNQFSDESKADKFLASHYAANSVLSGALLYFGRADGTGTVDVKIWDNTGAGGSPGSVLATQSINVNTIPTTGTPVLVNFIPTIPITTDFFVGIGIHYASPGDSVALFTNLNGETNPGTAWEQWNNNAWHTYNAAYTGYNFNVANAILTIACTQVATLVSNINSQGEIKIYPNPANDVLFAEVNFGYDDKLNVRLMNLLGETLLEQHNFNTRANKVMLDVSSLSNGLYLIEFSTGREKIMKKVQVSR